MQKLNFRVINWFKLSQKLFCMLSYVQANVAIRYYKFSTNLNLPWIWSTMNSVTFVQKIKKSNYQIWRVIMVTDHKILVYVNIFWKRRVWQHQNNNYYQCESVICYKNFSNVFFKIIMIWLCNHNYAIIVLFDYISRFYACELPRNFKLFPRTSFFQRRRTLMLLPLWLAVCANKFNPWLRI